MDIRSYRAWQGLTLAKLAEMVEVSEASMSRYQNGRVPRPEIVARIVKVTGGAVQHADLYQDTPADAA